MSAGGSVAFISGYRPFQFTDFSGGLNLRDKADAVGDKEAIDLLNVSFGERGAIRQRDGYADWTLVDLTNRADSMIGFSGSSPQMIIGCGTRLEAYDATGMPVASATGLVGGPWRFARFGDPTHEWLFAANGVDVLRRWDGLSWVSGAAIATVNGVAAQALPKAGAICVTAQHPGNTSAVNASNRLVATAFGTQTNAGPGGTTSTPSRVYFSNAGQPLFWETDGVAKIPPPTDPNDVAIRGRNFIDLAPGDGEAIVAAISWRELTFIFKETKFFVLWGEGAGMDGTPTFQVREVVNAIGLASPLALTAGRDGVYFMNRRGVYRTSGGDPVLLSDIVSPMWTQDPDVYFQSKPINLAQLALARMAWHEERLFLAVPTGVATANDRVLVYDTQHQWWSLYDWPASALTSFRVADRTELFLGYSSGPLKIGRQQIGLVRDRGVAISSRWRSGWSDYGSSQQRTLRETKVWGSGAAKIGFAVDFNRTLRGSTDVLFGLTLNWPVNGVGTWQAWIDSGNGAWPGGGQVSDSLIRYAVRGTVFSTQFTNSPFATSWSVHRVARHLREVREASIR